MNYLIIKNICDRFAALIILIFLIPFLLSLSILNYLFLGYPIIFSQERPGLNKKPFKLYKFRSMKILFTKDGYLADDNKRKSRYGNIIRKTSIDELPSLFNILKGDLSFVGPRPLLMEYLPIYSNKHSKRHDIKPGLTGWAAINGRNLNSWKKKLDFDIWYLKNISFILDIKILFITFYKVFKREGINTRENKLMAKLKENYYR